MKSLIVSIAILGLIGMMVGAVTLAAETATVSATVTAELITIAVADGSVDYGILPINTSKDTVAPSQTQVVTNNSNVAVDLEVKSSDAVGGVEWNLAATAAADAFTHEFAPDGSTWTAFNADNTIYASLTNNVSASGGTQNLDLKIGTPVSVSDNVQKTITVTVLATAS